jgi:hypothetical protein
MVTIHMLGYWRGEKLLAPKTQVKSFMCGIPNRAGLDVVKSNRIYRCYPHRCLKPGHEQVRELP